MKKIVAFLLAVIMLLSLTACQPSDAGDINVKIDPDKMGMEMGQTHSDYDGVSIRISNTYWDENGFVLEIDWINKTLHEGIFGASYIIERKEGEEWVSCQTVDDLTFIALAYVLSPLQTREETYHVSRMFDVSKAGTYRFRSDFSIDEKNNQNVWAEFSLSSDIDESQIKTQESVDYGVQYIRTDGGLEGVEYPSVVIIRSLDELNNYYETNKETFDLDRKDTVYSDTTIGFLDACDKYNAEYFEKGYLIFVLLEEGSGSVRHEVTGSTISSEGNLEIYIRPFTPEFGTSDMAQWHIILEMSNAVAVKDESAIEVHLDGSVAWNDGGMQSAAKFKEPPKGMIYTPDGDVTLTPVGYDWTVLNSDGTATTTIADQASRPLPMKSMKQVMLDEKYAETIYLPEPDSSVLVPTNSLGFLIKLDWETAPSSVQINCWPESVLQDSNTPEKTVAYQDGCFYAYLGAYVYEIVATWEDNGAGYHGSANYYVYISDVNGHGPADD